MAAEALTCVRRVEEGSVSGTVVDAERDLIARGRA